MKRSLIICFQFWIMVSVAYSQQSIPFLNGDDSWKELKSYADRVKAIQIPEKEIHAIPTDVLLNACMNYPYIADFSAFDDVLKGLEHVVSTYNGFGELLSRKDFVEAISKYLNTTFNRDNLAGIQSSHDKGLLSIQFLVAEYLASLWCSQNKEYPEVCKKIYMVISNCSDIGLKESKGIINGLNKVFLKTLNEELGEQPWFTQLFNYDNEYRYTFANNPVQVQVLADDDWNSNQVDYLNSYWKQQVPSAVLKGDATASYNCHGYAWYMYEDALDDPVNIPNNNNTPYITDGSYVLTTNPAEAVILAYGNGHSARLLPNGKYISKWGNGPLMEHERDSVPDGYLVKSNYMNYYKKGTATIVGPMVPCGSTTYYVSHYPRTSDVTITWSLVGATSAVSALLVQNYPNQNECTLLNDGSVYFNTTLVASIYKSGQLYATVSKHVQSDLGITFSQIGRTYNGYTYPDIPETSIENNSTIAVSQMCNVTITSPVFSTMTLTHTGATLSSWSKIGNTLFLSFPYDATMPRPTAYISGTDGCRSVNLTVVSYYGTTPIPTLQITPASGGFEASLVYPSGDSEIVLQANRPSATVEWDLEVHHATSGEKVIGKHIVGACETINTSGWKSGIYIVTAKVDGQILTQKVTVK